MPIIICSMELYWVPSNSNLLCDDDNAAALEEEAGEVALKVEAAIKGTLG